MSSFVTLYSSEGLGGSICCRRIPFKEAADSKILMQLTLFNYNIYCCFRKYSLELAKSTYVDKFIYIYILALASQPTHYSLKKNNKKKYCVKYN